MKTRNMARFLVVLSITALILTAGVYIVIASPPPPTASRLGPVAVSSSATEWSSGWVTMAQGELRTFTHTLGALRVAPERYAVEMWFQDTDGGLGINRRYYGGIEINGDPEPWRGAHWQNLTTDTIRIKRGPDDDVADMVNVRVWFTPVSPSAYDSGWRDIAPNTMRVFTHGLGITATDLTVGLWFSDPVRGIHQFAYGGLAVDPLTGTMGAFWHHLTTNTIQVTRYPSDTVVHQVRVSVVKSAPPAYDSGWQPVTPGQKLTLTHALNWSPDMLLVRGECYTPTLGIHQRAAGGDHVGAPPDAKWVGADLENLTNTAVVVYRQSEDVVCGEFRVRAWKRSMTIYLPAVFRDYQ
jgi:hypothetical protein